MSFTPKFEAVVNECSKAVEAKKSTGYIHDAFRQGCLEMGQYERLNNLYRIRPKRAPLGDRSRMQFFRMNAIQNRFWDNKTTRDLVLKMRQGGVTTLSCLIALDNSIWVNGSHNAIMAHKRDNVKKIFKITKSAFRSFQKDWYDFLPITEGADNVSELEVNETGSSLMVATETKGLTLDFLHISEAAFIEDARISESVESVPLSSHIIMETTPDVASGMFYELWDRGERASQAKTSQTYTNHFFPWWFHYPEPEDISLLKAEKDFTLSDKEHIILDMIKSDISPDELTPYVLWRRLKISESGGDEGEFMRKYPEDPMTCFLSGSRSVFPASTLVNLWRGECDPRFFGDLNVETS